MSLALCNHVTPFPGADLGKMVTVFRNDAARIRCKFLEEPGRGSPPGDDFGFFRTL